MGPKGSFDRVLKLLKEHHKWSQETVNLIASENVPSPAVREALVSDFGNRYAEGAPGKRLYAGCKYIDEVEFLAIDLAKEVFGAAHANVQPVSGVVANLATYTAFTQPGDTLMSLSITCGGHISMGKKKFGGTAGSVHGLDVEYFPFDEEAMNIDVERAREKIKEVSPDLVLFGASVFPFPHPVKELSDVASDCGARIAYDAAHVAGLIGGGHFQNPLEEGAEVMNCSTHKTLPGPQHGMILTAEEDLKEIIDRSVFPGVVSNHHLHSVAALAISLAENLEFGEEYGSQIIKNAKSLGEALYNRGVDVLASEKGFTSSHVILADVTDHGLGGEFERKLEDANVIVNRNLLPWDVREGRHYDNPGGIRLGVSEVTRLGMEEEDMERIADFIGRVVIEDENPEIVRKDVEKFARDYSKVNYCFESETEAYEYINIHS
ncbi:serine hydroxymethyltransferase [candidate division MSBL1 archaeon SCGC-AAA259I09]|uniref:Serine hydroxymethyltransferase n=4 Tax=candidate division MSBL1 TaxID=215777 RepID=A0A133UUL2_9EURY|nr:serine hydroxymethyltransferase [candidate division MSBL1 archaeon SCGC-AAA259B11]KXA93703.1 serine hydroxymethyltransferase [candidate division MSBL1 archaeon SCGC-AAA259E22]KXA97895.1 serine hydroxymethyltransferase [candidate division MSBL1 archaeon SCGC-AAA259I09]KXB00333.1 serine hydroxymethyltransferase [candidate division MSBL1 archaeon SCGC-AAA259M10]